MKVKYVGKSFGIDGLVDGNIYEVLYVDYDIGAFGVIDESGEDYLYSPLNPRPVADSKHSGGRFEIVEDSEAHELYKAMLG